jgi:cell wall-associated NlpC family hydrolase
MDSKVQAGLKITAKAVTVAMFGIGLSTTPADAATVNGLNVGTPSNQPHAWGKCKVQDFNGGPYGWVIVDTTTSTPRVVRNGMLWGWFDNAGAPGALGCPTSSEYGVAGGNVRQDFQGGSLAWSPGMDHAAKLADGRSEQAIAWANLQTTSRKFDGLCLGFVASAYGNKLKNGPYGQTVRAIDWWNSSKDRHPGDTNPPRGALVFWSTYASGTGHAALSLGNGYAISTQFDGAGVHVIKISSYPTHYAGWASPQF